MEESLHPACFMCIHRKTIVAASRIVSVRQSVNGRTMVTLVDGHEFPVGRN